MQRQFTRRFALPKGTKMDTINCDMGDRGVLTITGRNHGVVQAAKRAIPIQHKKMDAPALDEK